MNSIMREQSNLYEQTRSLRDQMLDLLTDADLAYQLPGDNVPLGVICHEMGEFQQGYIKSFKTFKHEGLIKNPDTSLQTDLTKLKTWFKTLDVEMLSTLEALKEDDIQNKLVDRGDFSLPVTAQFHVYRESLLIYYGKISIYLKALGKTFTSQWQGWIG